MKHRTIAATLFGGALFAPGVAQADEHFNFTLVDPVVIPYLSYARASIGNGQDTVYAATDPAYAHFAAYEAAGCAPANPLQRSIGWGIVASQYIEASATNVDGGCYGVSGMARATFGVVTPTTVRLEWIGPEAGSFNHFDLWHLVTPFDWTHIAGNFTGPLDLAGSVLVILDPGIYYVDFDTGVTGGYTRAPSARLEIVGDAGAACPCDLDGNGALNLDDVNTFAAAFVAGDLAADLDASGTLNLDDINMFASCFVGGCP